MMGSWESMVQLHICVSSVWWVWVLLGRDHQSCGDLECGHWQAWPLLLRLCAPCDPGHWSHQSWSQSLVLPGPPSHPVTQGAASTRYQTLSHCTDTTHWPSSWPYSVTSWGTSRCPMASRDSRASNCDQASGLETWVHHMLVGSLTRTRENLTVTIVHC